MLLAVAGSALLIAATVLGFVLLGGGGGEAATDVGTRFRELGGSFQTLPAAPNLRYKGQAIRHVPAMPPGYRYNSNPPSSGIHTDQTVIYGIYDEPVPAISSVHNLEHGGIVIRYGPDVAQSDVEQLGEFYLDDPNGLVIAPMPGLGKTIALAAWTFDRSRESDRTYQGEGRLAKSPRFDEDAFKAFVDAFRGHGPEDFDVADLAPGGP
jgi:Protein of unknown function (DUF3105)